MERLWRIICSNDSNISSEDLEFARRDIQNLFGSSGGGATALYLDNTLAGVAGSGGGLFPQIFILPTDNKSDPSGGEFSEPNKITPKPFFANWIAGNGASFGQVRKVFQLRNIKKINNLATNSQHARKLRRLRSDVGTT